MPCSYDTLHRVDVQFIWRWHWNTPPTHFSRELVIISIQERPSSATKPVRVKFQSKQIGLIAQPKGRCLPGLAKDRSGDPPKELPGIYWFCTPNVTFSEVFPLELWARNCFSNHTMPQALRTSVYYLKTERTSGWVVWVGVGQCRGGLKRNGKETL